MSFGRKAAERLANRSILITGASSGIGEACAKVFAEASNGQIKLILGARRKERLIKLSDTLIKQYPNIKIHHDFLDVTIKDSISKFIAGIPTDFEPDVLINNSGKALGKEQVGELKDEDITEMLDTNVVGVIRMTQAVLPLLKRKIMLMLFSLVVLLDGLPIKKWWWLLCFKKLLFVVLSIHLEKKPLILVLE